MGYILHGNYPNYPSLNYNPYRLTQVNVTPPPCLVMQEENVIKIVFISTWLNRIWIKLTIIHQSGGIIVVDNYQAAKWLHRLFTFKYIIYNTTFI